MLEGIPSDALGITQCPSGLHTLRWYLEDEAAPDHARRQVANTKHVAGQDVTSLRFNVAFTGTLRGGRVEKQFFFNNSGPKTLKSGLENITIVFLDPDSPP